MNERVSNCKNNHGYGGTLGKMRRLCTSLRDLPGFRREVDTRLNGKPSKPSSLPLPSTRRLGETRISQGNKYQETCLVTEVFYCVFHPKIMLSNGIETFSLQENNTYLPPASNENPRFKEIVREHTRRAESYVNVLNQRILKVEDVVKTVSRLESEYMKRDKTPTQQTNSLQNTFGFSSCKRCRCDSFTPLSSMPPKRTLIVKIPGTSDNSDENSGSFSPVSNLPFSYRHKK